MESRDYKLIIARIEDLAENAQRYHRMVFTPFLDPAMIKRAKTILRNYKDLECQVVGAYPEAERNIILIYPDWMDGAEIDIPISALHIGWDHKYYKIGHRDILGSVLGLGIKREKIGDIIVENHYAYVIAYKDISVYIAQNLIKVGKAPVTVEEIGINELEITEKRGKLKKTTVSSLRLDCVLSAGFGMSRSKVIPHISNGLVQVNWEPNTKPDYVLKEGDMISFRKRGRIKVVEVVGMSKKNRYHIILEKW